MSDVLAVRDADRLFLTGKERFLDEHSLIVSKTDSKGIMTYVNKIFLDISDYTEAEMLGKPHNAIRHPHMPRAVFKLLWDSIKAGNEIFAYVVNRCKTGDHYWVLAHVTPCADLEAGRNILGFHSNRRAPRREAVQIVQPLYKQMCDIEERLGGRAGIEASSKLLADFLAQKQMSYDHFVLSI